MTNNVELCKKNQWKGPNFQIQSYDADGATDAGARLTNGASKLSYQLKLFLHCKVQLFRSRP